MSERNTGGKNMKTLLQNRGGQMKPYSVIDTYNQAVYDICPTLKANYYKMGVANFVYHKGCGDGFLAPCVIEISNERADITQRNN